MKKLKVIKLINEIKVFHEKAQGKGIINLGEDLCHHLEVIPLM